MSVSSVRTIVIDDDLRERASALAGKLFRHQIRIPGGTTKPAAPYIYEAARLLDDLVHLIDAGVEDAP